jgi:uncharacterized membrane protein YfcA
VVLHGRRTPIAGNDATAETSAMLAIFLAIGLAAGVLSGLFGIGGGIVIVPALLFFAKMSPSMATGTSLGALLLPVGALGAWEYWRSGDIDLRASALVALGLFFGAFLGAKLNHFLTPAQAKRIFAVFLVAVAVRMWMSARTA